MSCPDAGLPSGTEIHRENLIDAQLVHKLLEVVRLITLEKNPDDLLLVITEHGASALQAERGSIFLLDEVRGEIWSKIALGEAGIIRFPRGVGIAGEVIEKASLIRIPDAYADSRFNRRIDIETGFRTRNILAIPMINADGKTIGCFQLINKKGGDFTERDESFGDAFAAQAAVAIESALLHKQNSVAINNLEEARLELQGNVKLLRVLYEIEQDGHAIHDLKEFLFEACKKTLQATNGYCCTLLLESVDHEWNLFGILGGAEPRLLSKRIEDTEAIENYLSELPGSADFFTSSPAKNSHYLEKLLPMADFKSIMLTKPQISVNTPHGEVSLRAALEVFSLDADAFTTTDLRFVENIGAKIGSMVEKKMLIEQQAQSSRLAVIGQLTSSIIHDFKNPLMVMQGFAEIIERRREANPEKLQHFGSVIRAQVVRCRNMIEELLRFARGEKSFAFEQVQMVDFFKEIETVLAVEVSRQKVGLQLNMGYADSLWMDREKILRLIFNLTNNAMEVLKEGDTITIDCERMDSGMIRIQVTDSGPGIPESIRKTLFDAFVTAGKKGGTGLGLHIAKDIAAGHMGSISLDESHQGGARFVVMLHPDPRQQGAAT